MPTMAESQGLRPGGVISLVAGPPGSGKTTLAMSLGSRMAELGSEVVYLTAEEGLLSLSAKRISVVDTNRVLRSLWPDAQIAGLEHQFSIRDNGSLDSLRSIVNAVKSDLGTPPQVPSFPGQVVLAFPHVVIVDSISALIGEASPSPTRAVSHGRLELASMLRELRELGVCVFLIGEKSHIRSGDLAYLVDNVFVLDIDPDTSTSHPKRTFSIEKTRLQLSFRGRHVYHLSRFEGPTISPSLHAVLRLVARDNGEQSQKEARVVMWSSFPKQTALPGIDATGGVGEAISVRANSHLLIYGWGTTGKARLALSTAFATQVPTEELERRLDNRSGADQTELTAYGRIWMERVRVLVFSFLYPQDYYSRIIEEILRQRRLKTGSKEIDSRATVEALYPGYLDPETLIDRLRRRLATARQQGRPYTAVVMDGVHNMLLQFPLLSSENLLWPTIFRILRAEGVTAISTFTFFQISASEKIPGTSIAAVESAMVPSDLERMFHHLLVSNCDYSFLVTRLTEGPPKRRLHVARTATIDGMGKERMQFYWDSDRLECWCED